MFRDRLLPLIKLPRLFWVWFWAFMFSLMLATGYALYWEIKISFLQARYLSRYAAHMTYTLEPGTNPELQFPEEGPYNQRLGYSYLPSFIKALQSDGFEVSSQARMSPTMHNFVRHGGFPSYRPKAAGGLRIFDRQGETVHTATAPTRTFAHFNDVPTLLANTLLFIENRELLRTPYATHNPVISWGRLAVAMAGQVISYFVPRYNAGGGSTLAIQIEKFRHSPGGQTNGFTDKVRQIASANVRAYLDGPNTRNSNKRIVLDYLNSTPLAARPGWGEINGIGDGLWAWFGIELADAVKAMNGGDDQENLARKADVFKHSLALILAQRRPAYYLMGDHAALAQLVAATLDRLLKNGQISLKLYNAAQTIPLHFLPTPPALQQNSFIAQKASNAIRRYLLSSLGLDNLYELDRFDMTVGSTLDLPVQKKVAEFLQKLHDPAFNKTIGLQGHHLLDPQNDPTKINWTIVLFERTPQGNALRIQADNLDQPLDLNDGAKLDLGSTAKLRTLITYLEIIADLHQRYHTLDNDALDGVIENSPDKLTEWAAGWLKQQKADNRALAAMLAAAMERTYSAGPGEGFYTGGGLHYFNNFDDMDDTRTVTLTESLRKSINLPFIRLMRDIVNYITAQGSNPKEEILGDPDHPARRAYMERFAKNEGAQYLTNFYATYNKLSPEEMLEKLGRRSRKHPVALAVIYRFIRPQGRADEFINFVRKLRPENPINDTKLQEIYYSYPRERYNLADRGYIAGLHPLELWLVEYLSLRPNATRKAMLVASVQERLSTYAWLFNSSKVAQDNRIRSLLEQDAFATIQQDWAKFGYPFERLVPSLATAIGSSADRPGALAELMGIIINDGIRLPIIRADYVNWAVNTPYQTMMTRQLQPGVRVMPAEVAEQLRRSLMNVVVNGTAKRVDGAFTNPDGSKIAVGGKTGTGDHRFDTYAPGGQVISSRVVNRTATFVFYIGDRFFGSITAYVGGEQAGEYRFTSAMPSQMLRALAPTLQPLITSSASKP
ncbi:MAG: transglycosylase domain-containing protein [Alphaproteobacteria bacterium]